MTANPSDPLIHAHPPANEWLTGGGEMGHLIRSTDWSKTSLGPIEVWPQSLRSAVSILLPSKAQIAMFWGPDLITLYNDAYSPVLGKKHPGALGLPIREVWSELWGAGLKELFEGVLNTGEAFWASDHPFYMERYGFAEETFFDISYDPIRDETGKVGGLFCIVSDTTARVVGERRLTTLRDLSLRASAETKSVEDACRAAGEILAGNRNDLPFALIYLLDPSGNEARLVGASGLVPGSLAAPKEAGLKSFKSQSSSWPFEVALRTNRPVEIADVISKFGELPSGVWPESPHTAVVMPIGASGQERPVGFLVAGVSPRRPLDDHYRAFFDLLTTQISTAIANARAYEVERKRAEALAELDRAKTTFFSNVSHEFRTPLTLMLGPVDDILTDEGDSLEPTQRERLEIAQRNGLRLQKLVNTLLDFSRIEAGRMQASYEATDLATFTSDLASNFRSACEKAGLDLEVDCPPLNEPIFVDQDMWEKIVLNLLSNAFKFTLSGTIEVRLRQTDHRVELSVTDTGIGIPPEELSKLFERFQRVEASRGRTQEGSGIGLAFVRELVKLHKGSVTVESALGRGSVFKVSIPRGKSHLPPEQIKTKETRASTSLGAAPFVAEALRWLPDTEVNGTDLEEVTFFDALASSGKVAPSRTLTKRPRILLADDNADMRDYVRRLLGERYDVRTVADGQAALDTIQEWKPDLILSDVMMPVMDGFELLRRIRSSSSVPDAPVILLSARAGEDSRIEGLQATADDYLTKPFGARELLATIEAQLKMSDIRRETQKQLRASEERYRQILGTLPVAVYTCEASSGEITFYNQRAAELWGRAPKVGDSDERFCGSFRLWRSNNTLLPHDETPMAVALREDRAFRNQDVIIERPDGSRISVLVNIDPVHDSQGRLVGAINAFQDTTELNATQRALAMQNERSRLLWEAAAVLLTTDDPDTMLRGLFEKIRGSLALDVYFNFVVNGNGDALDLISCAGIPKETALSISKLNFGQAVCGTVALQRRPIVATHIQSSLDPMVQLVKGFGVRAYACNPLLAGSDLLGTLSFASRTRDSFDAEEIEFLETITQYVTVAYERLRLIEKLREQDRRKDEFIATLAHELRNPLAPIRNGLELIRRSDNNEATLEQATTMMQRQVEQMVRLVDDLMDVSRISRNKLELRKTSVDLETIVRSAVETSRPLIESAKHDLKISLPPEPVLLEADPVRLAQAFSNLLNNAAKYSPPGGSISLTAQRRDGELIVKVRDTGIGIDAKKLPQIFDMFVQVDGSDLASQGGLGVGLTLVRRLVEMHNGRVDANSDGIGKGSEFTIRLPVAEAREQEQSTLQKTTPSNPSQRQQRILVVDDNQDSAESMAMMLQLSGHEVMVAHDGLEAIELVKEFQPDLAFLDLGMPRLDGYDAARIIRQQPEGENLILVALTGWGQEEDKRRTHEAGFDAHVVKPIDFAALEELLNDSQRLKGW